MSALKDKLFFYTDKKTQIEKFWHRYQFSSRSKAIAWLVAYALSLNPTPPPQRDDDEYYD